MITVDDLIRRFGNDAVARAVGTHDDRDCAIAGHWLYCRMCVTPDVKDKDGKVLIYLPDGPPTFQRGGEVDPSEQNNEAPAQWEHYKNFSLWLEVLAKGVRVGKRREGGKWTKALRKERGVPIQLIDGYSVGDIIMCPKDHPWGMWWSPFARDEYLIDEWVPICKVEKPNA